MLLAVCSKKERHTNYLKQFATDITAKKLCIIISVWLEIKTHKQVNFVAIKATTIAAVAAVLSHCLIESSKKE